MLNRIQARNHKGISGQQGFTILEVLIAIGIFSIGILAVAAMQVASIKGNAAAQGVTDIAVFATDRLEKLMVLPYNHTDLDAGVHSVAAGNVFLDGANGDGIDNDFDGIIDEGGENGPLTIQWTVVDDMPILDSKTVRVTVRHVAPSVDREVEIIRVIPRIL